MLGRFLVAMPGVGKFSAFLQPCKMSYFSQFILYVFDFLKAGCSIYATLHESNMDVPLVGSSVI